MGRVHTPAVALSSASDGSEETARLPRPRYGVVCHFTPTTCDAGPVRGGKAPARGIADAKVGCAGSRSRRGRMCHHRMDASGGTMSMFRWTSRTLPAIAGLLAITAVGAEAETAVADQPLFTWTGTVDREVLLVMRGNRVETRGADARLPNNARVIGQIPRSSSNGDVRVRIEGGRGAVDVIEQPSSRNGYQTVVRIRDPQGGSDRYRVVAYWTGSDDRYGNNGGYGNNDRDRDRDRGNNGRGNDDRYGRNDDCRYDGRSDNRRNDDRRDNRRDDRRNDGRCDDDRYGNNGGYGNNASGPGTLSWSGRVDDVVDITIRGRNVEYRARSGASVSDVRSRISGGALPARDGQVTIIGGNGRGSVQVIQQPSRSNNYTAVIRVSDPRGGAASYDFDARW